MSSVVITELPPEHAKKALELVCLPSITPLQVSTVSVVSHSSKFKMLLAVFLSLHLNKQEITNQGGAVLQQLPARQLTVHIDRLACIFR